MSKSRNIALDELEVILEALRDDHKGQIREYPLEKDEAVVNRTYSITIGDLNYFIRLRVYRHGENKTGSLRLVGDYSQVDSPT